MSVKLSGSMIAAVRIAAARSAGQSSVIRSWTIGSWSIAFSAPMVVSASIRRLPSVSGSAAIAPSLAPACMSDRSRSAMIVEPTTSLGWVAGSSSGSSTSAAPLSFARPRPRAANAGVYLLFTRVS